MGAMDKGGWDEEEWEQYLRRADARTAKFQELYETFRHHPRRNEIIAQEMGWRDALLKCGGPSGGCAECPKRLGCEAYEMLYLTADPDSIANDPEAAALLMGFHAVEEISAYDAAQRFVDDLERQVQRTPTALEDQEVREALEAAQTVPVKIAEGHGIGYEPDALCGNIASCKRARAHLARCVDLLRNAADRRVLPEAIHQAIRARA